MVVDLVIKDVQVYNAYFKEFESADVAILEGKFLYIGKEEINRLEPKIEINGNNNYMIPGLIDIHMHIESSMTTPYHFAQGIIPHGTTTIVSDPHEIANVFGTEGIKAMIDSYTENAVDIFYGVPSSVPSTSEALETTGGVIKEGDVKDIIGLDKICCLGEVMNFKDLIGDKDSLINNIINIFKERAPHMQLEGHCPKIWGLDLAKYIYTGVDADHTHQTVKSIEDKIKNGMFIEIQEKSMTQENIDYLVKNNLYEHFCFVTDDVMTDKLLDGHLNTLVKKAIDMGMPPEMAIYCATYTPSRRMGFRDRGAISPGKIADFILLSDLNTFNINAVYKMGREIFNGNIMYKDGRNQFPKEFYRSVNLDKVSKDSFLIDAPIDNGDITCRIIHVNSDSTFTNEVEGNIQVLSGRLDWEQSPYCLISVFDRYGKSNNVGYGLVTGSAINEGAVASTYAHDHHNLMVMGKNSRDMTIATNWIIENQGGYCVVKDGEVLAAIKLPVAGILSEEKIDILGTDLKKVRDAMKKLGYNHYNEIMSFSTLSLPVSHDLKITDKGLIDVKEQKIVSLFKI